MHIDATGESGRGTLFGTYAGGRNWVLGSWKIATECSELILPCLRETAELFGPPMAIMRDLGKAVTPAARALVDELAQSIPILACHFHFLRDVGTDLQKEDHDRLREGFRRFGIRTALRNLARDLGRRLKGQLGHLRGRIAEWANTHADHSFPGGTHGLATVRALAQWAIDYNADAPHGFPFDLPYLAFYQRCYQVRRAIDAFLRRPPEDTQVRSALQRLARLLDPVIAELPFEFVARRLSARAALSGRLRDALRIRPDGAPMNSVLPADQAAEELKDIKAAIEGLSKALRSERPQRGPAEDTRKAIDLLLDHLERHGDSLWGHVIPLPPETGGGVRVVDRTNRVQEGFWHQLKHGERRRSGRKTLTHDFETLPAAAALARNLEQSDYVAILCGSLDRLPSEFATLHRSPRTPQPSAEPGSGSAKHTERNQTRDPDAEDSATASLPRPDRRLLRRSKLGDKIRTAARSRAPRYKPRQAAL